MSNNNNNNLEMAKDMAYVQAEVGQFGKVVDSLNESIKQIADANTNTAKILAVHENKLNTHNKSIGDLQNEASQRDKEYERKLGSVYERISDLKEENHKERDRNHKEVLDKLRDVEKSLSTKIEDGMDEIDKVGDRVAALERWKWWVLGAVAALMFIITNSSKIMAIFS